MPLLLVVGSLNYDLILRHHVLPRGGETVVGAELTVSCGGKGANQAVAAARFAKALDGPQVSVAFAGALGNDLFGERQRQQLRADGVDTTHLRTFDGVATGTSTIWVESSSGQNRILNAPGANLHLRPDGLADLPWSEADLLLLQNEIPAETTGYLCRRAAAEGVDVVWDPAPFSAGDELPLKPEQVRFVTPNEREAEALLGRPLGTAEALREDAESLLRLGFGNVILTLGELGVAVRDRDGRFYEIPAPAVDAIDTTGAGDAFCGAFAASLLAGMPEEEAIGAGVAYATSSVCKAGAQSSFPEGRMGS